MRAAFWAMLLVVLVLSLLPDPSRLPSTGWDKANHLLGFVMLSLLGLHAYRSRTAIVLSGLFMYGVLIELLQSFTPDRYPELEDLIANGIGLGIGWIAGTVLQRFYLHVDKT